MRQTRKFSQKPLPRWARLSSAALDAALDAHFFAGAALARLDQILRSGADVSSAGKSRGEGGLEPVFVGALRQRLALRAAAACAAMTRLREVEAALRDAEHLGGFDAAPTPGGRLHRLWRLFVTRQAQINARLDARFIRTAADCLELPSHIDCQAITALLQEAMRAENPLNAAARVSGASLQNMSNMPQIEAEVFVLWLADLALAQKLRWKAPVPLLATAILHPGLRRDPNGRRPRPADRDWPHALPGAYALAACEAIDLAGALSRQTEKLFDAAPKLRAKGAERVIEMLLADDCVAAARAAKTTRLSDRGARRLFDRLTELGAVRELSGRPSFRLYGL